MPYLIPSRTPLTPDQVERGFDYLLARQMGGGASVAGRAEADPELAFILLRLAEDIVWPVTALLRPGRGRVRAAVRAARLGATPPPRRRWASPAASSGSW
ncbi:hypothetical protein PV387_26995 [Streptomyces sp. ME02-6987-2C]|uniref:hypothetical protein n=1 Tax=unclassified Streptomyces TaxID=2593676 RepID=UPI0029A344CB|nr:MULTISPECIES: hypothetical protein [unclassified Streptomyces]MDX3369628.1 hypothetical protein [Streptomyces sp. ME02-6987-2C]MDX3403349.1 hypothetical protein [Streptomyces sp. ME01-18h]MDX3427039.1 hypothetical protein [Streptomyces sp. ME02-6985-2c]